MGIPQLANFCNAANGTDLNDEGVLEIGDRIYTMERMFNLKAGIDPSEDKLPKRMLEEPLPDGPTKGNVCKLSDMLPDYYQVRGWGSDGIPTEAKLQELGLA
jgi:aldehyde:ferredoxin oxidoreductase